MSFARSKPGPLAILTAPVRIALTDPRITAPVLIALTYFPLRLQARLPASLYKFLTSPAVIKALRVALSIGLLRQLNNIYSRYTVNNWKPDARFIKSQELVLITGGCSGIGELMAKQFAEKGIKVVVLDINAPKNPLPANIFFYEADVTSSSKIADVATEIRRDHGDPTVLINNAGIGTGATILGGEERMIQKTFEVNTISHFWMVREFLPAMIKKDHGHVVTIASMASYIVHAGNVDYSCSKAAALAFHEGLSSELRARYKAPNVKTTVVNPGWIRTPLLEALLASPKFKDPVLEMEEVTTEIVKQVLAGRSGQLILPTELNIASTIRSWPSWMQYGTRNKIAHVLEGPEGWQAT